MDSSFNCPPSFNPGAARYGNFINYYEFNIPENRLQLIPQTLIENLFPNRISPLVMLDIGCNSGEMTKAINEHFVTNTDVEFRTLAIDLDPILISRAQTNNNNPNITFSCINIMKEDAAAHLTAYLEEFHQSRFDIGFCFAVTMWIHLNHGDEGLKNFLTCLSSMVNYLIIEPQPWQCYRSAARRLRRSKQEEFCSYDTIQNRSNVLDYIDGILTKDLTMIRSDFPGETKWGRQIIMYKNSS